MKELAKFEQEPHIKVKSGGQVVTTSLDIAENFSKPHKNVLKAIREVECSDEFSRLHFKPRNYHDDRGKVQPYFEITRDGFTFLVMGFKGKKAATWKEKYISAFNAMEKVLSNQANNAWQELRKQGKGTRIEETDTIKRFVEYATTQGSTKANWYYKHITNATYKALFIIKDKSGKSCRDMLDNMQLSFLNTAEYVARNAMEDGMKQRMHYKDIYLLCKDKVEAVASTVGVTEVISHNPQLSLV